MTQQELIETLEGYEQELDGIIARFHEGSDDGIWIDAGDDGRFRQIVHELRDIFQDHITDGGRHSTQLVADANASVQNFYNSPSLHGVQTVRALTSSVLTRVRRDPAAVLAVAKAARAASKKDPAFIVRLTERLPTIIRELRNRHDERPTLDVDDEYDLQDLVRSLLAIHFDDIRPEEWTPSYAGGSARMDFYLPEVEAVIETKMTRKGLNGKKLGEELLIDIARYQNYQHCKSLYCIVYDPEQRIQNPRGLENDIEKHSITMTARVMIVPRQ
jgi:REase_DpnII-MboI